MNRLSNWFNRLGGGGDKPNDGGNGAGPRLKIRAGHCTSIGNYRDNNEDRLFVDPERQIYVVADGMGGQAAGEQASQIAVDLIPQQVRSIPMDTTDEDVIRKTLTDAFVAANEAILEQGLLDPSIQNMGTTAVICLVRANQVFVAHIGDSRAFHFRAKAIDFATTDHNLAQALHTAGTINDAELKNHRFKNVLYKYLGSKDSGGDPDISKFEVRSGDRIVLATDGLTGSVDDAVILREVYKYNDPQECSEKLVRLALDQGSKDNVTVVVFYVD